MIDDIVILISTTFVWIINRGKKPFNEIYKNVHKFVSDGVLKILQLFVLIFILIIVFGILIAIYSWIQKF